MKKQTMLTPLLFAALLLLFSGAAHGYAVIKTQGGKPVYWDNPHQAWFLDEDGSKDVSFDKVEEVLVHTFQLWTDVPCSKFEAEYKGTTDLSAPDLDTGANDGQNTIIWKENDWPDGMPEALALCLPFYYSSGPDEGKMVDADIIFNGDWVEWTTADEGEVGKMDIWSVALHEMGHFVGLDHSAEFDATMYYAVTESDLSKRTLSPDDIQGVCSIYPNPGAPLSPCSEDDDCDSGVCAQHDLSHGKICTSECECYPACPVSLDCVEGYCLPTTETTEIGDPCSSDAPDCGQDLLCLLSTETDGICTAYCEANEDCPEGMRCVSLTNGQKACFGTPVDPNAAPFSIVQFKAEPLQDDGTALTDVDITLTATIMASEGLAVEFRFLVRGLGEQWRYIDEGFSTELTRVWRAEVPGYYELRVDAREKESDACYQVQSDITLTVLENPATPGDDDDDDVSTDGDDTNESDGGGDGGCRNVAGPAASALALLLLFGMAVRRRREHA